MMAHHQQAVSLDKILSNSFLTFRDNAETILGDDEINKSLLATGKPVLISEYNQIKWIIELGRPSDNYWNKNYLFTVRIPLGDDLLELEQVYDLSHHINQGVLSYRHSETRFIANDDFGEATYIEYWFKNESPQHINYSNGAWDLYCSIND